MKPLWVAIPPGEIKLNAPVEPLPTMATIDVDETTVNDDTDVPPRVTAEVPEKLFPVMVMMAPFAAVVGVNEMITGAGMKLNPSAVALPPGVTRLIAPLEPLPTMATIIVDETTVNDETDVPPNVMDEVLSKFEPVIVIWSPNAAAVGVKLEIIGAGMKMNPSFVAVP